MKPILSIPTLTMLIGLLLPMFFIGSRFAVAAETSCELTFSMKSWSVFYKSGKGSGTIVCDNGQKAKVRLRSHGGGLTFGKGKILDGHGTFSKASSIQELYGAYATAGAGAGAGDSASAQALSKGDISLTLTGNGKGINIGFDFGKLTISKR